MTQNPVKSTLFVTQLVAGTGITLSPTYGTGIVTVSTSGSDTFTTLTVTGTSTLNTTQVSTLTATQTATFQATIQCDSIVATQLSTFTTVQMSSLTSTQLAVPPSGTVTVNGVTVQTVSFGGITSGSSILFTLKTVGGTVGTPHVVTITPSTGFNVASQASDTSTYNYLVIG